MPERDGKITILEPLVITDAKKFKPLKEDVDREFVNVHDRITDLYYHKKQLSREEFEALHSACWLYHQAALIDYGYEEDHEVSEPWEKPKTRREEIDEILETLKPHIETEKWRRCGCEDPKVKFNIKPKKSKTSGPR
ncbi:MAG: hypothetical protein QXT73_00760 [Candidatus Methanomethylicaceae archaeon]